ncbi:MAG: acetyl-CoA carboxylase biotin carboxyl carrier protein [Acetobacteraceae bacterium]|nr:acetyl-CoA carboxylase biotin carboxyl carrier protein [Acetobacteraceae bacterium]MBV9775447.1 acetyl-CoA carboxylase biotin carboxyl carrier protein [Acetobacteraceae bacterium]
MTRIPMDPDAIRALAGILTETGLTEIEIAEKDSRIRVVRAPGTAVPGAAAPVGAAPPDAALAPPASEADALASHPGAVLSPMVGVVYLSPEPGAAPFVTLGQTVSAGQTVLLIEAMKTFNHIKAPRAGTVARILVANASPVEYGEPLMLIDA